MTTSSGGDDRRPDSLQVGLLVFPDITQLDLTGPLQVFSSVPGITVHLVWKDLGPVSSDTPLVLLPTTTFDDCPQLDVICVPGGLGTDALLEDDLVLGFLRSQAEGARYVTSVCTGALVLGAAGLLQGYRATTHWSAIDCLAPFGAIPTKTRVCIDRNRVTGGGVTAGIDFALTLVAELVGRSAAEAAQLRLEYNPAPPFDAGSPDSAPPPVVDSYLERTRSSKATRVAAVARAASRLA
ncbi:DJ-1/PfpI family protein [soil metagenome]